MSSKLSLSIANLLDTSNPAPLYRKYPRETKPQPAHVELTEDGIVSADYAREIGGTTPMYVWNGRTRRWSVPPEIRGEALARMLQSPGVLGLLERVLGGHSVVWDGPNRVGRLSEDARGASEQLERDFERLKDDPNALVQVASAAAWLFPGSVSVLDHWPQGPLADAAATARRDAWEQSAVHLDGDVERCLLDQAAAMVADEKPGFTEDHLGALIEGGLIDAETADCYRALAPAAQAPRSAA